MVDPAADEVLVAVFNFCDDRTRMMTIPAVSKRWLGVCQMRRAVLDLTWAVRIIVVPSPTPGQAPGWCAGSQNGRRGRDGRCWMPQPPASQPQLC